MKLLLKNIIEDIFYISSIFLIILCFCELISPKFATPYVNLDLLLIISVISGIFILVTA
ncbi:MAG: hypothetical protein V1655_01735 [bacterium]